VTKFLLQLNPIKDFVFDVERARGRRSEEGIEMDPRATRATRVSAIHSCYAIISNVQLDLENASTQQADAEQIHKSVQKRKSATNFCEGICGEAMGNFKDGTTCAAVRGCGSTLPACRLPPRG